MSNQKKLVLRTGAAAGTVAELRTETERLTARLKVLHDGDAAVATIKPDKSDPSGYRLSNMLEWRRQRKAAIAAEIARLEKQAARLAQTQAVWGSADDTKGGNGLELVNRELLTWLETNGAEVSLSTLVGTCAGVVSTTKTASILCLKVLKQSCPLLHVTFVDETAAMPDAAGLTSGRTDLCSGKPK